MTKMLIVVPVLLVVALAIGCRTVQPDAGHEAVLVRKPLIFGSGGVDPTPVTGVPVRVLDMSLGRQRSLLGAARVLPGTSPLA